MQPNSDNLPRDGEPRETETLVNRLLSNCGKLLFEDGMKEAHNHAREEAEALDEALSEEVTPDSQQEPHKPSPKGLNT